METFFASCDFKLEVFPMTNFDGEGKVEMSVELSPGVGGFIIMSPLL
jgi:hypothetical protein